MKRSTFCRCHRGLSYLLPAERSRVSPILWGNSKISCSMFVLRLAWSLEALLFAMVKAIIRYCSFGGCRAWHVPIS